MKKPFVLVAAVVAVVGFGAVVAVAKEKTKVETSVKLNFNAGSGDPSDPYANRSFSGKVKAKKGCKKERKVTVKQVGGAKVGSDKSDDGGKYEISAGSSLAAGDYVAKASKKKITKNNGDQIVCEKGTSDPVTVS